MLKRKEERKCFCTVEHHFICKTKCCFCIQSGHVHWWCLIFSTDMQSRGSASGISWNHSGECVLSPQAKQSKAQMDMKDRNGESPGASTAPVTKPW